MFLLLVKGPSLKSKLGRISFVVSDFLVWVWGMGYGTRGCVGGISLTLTSIPWAFSRRLFYCSVLNFFDIKVCLCSYWRGNRMHGSPVLHLQPLAKLRSCQKEQKAILLCTFASTAVLGLNGALFGRSVAILWGMPNFRGKRTPWMNPWEFPPQTWKGARASS